MNVINLTEESIQGLLTDLLKRSPNNYREPSMKLLRRFGKRVTRHFFPTQKNLITVCFLRIPFR